MSQTQGLTSACLGPGQMPYYTCVELNYSLGRPKLVKFVVIPGWLAGKNTSADPNKSVKLKWVEGHFTEHT